jgi:hypothetical protein
MAHEPQSTRLEELLQLLSEHGFDGMAEAIEILMNEAMKLERAEEHLDRNANQTTLLEVWLTRVVQSLELGWPAGVNS